LNEGVFVNTKVILTGFLVVSVLAACKQNAEPAAPASTDAEAIEQPAASPGPAATAAKVTFEVVPATVNECNGAAPIVANVKWSVEDAAVTEVKVEVDSKSQEPQLLSIGGRAGEAKTDAWVVSGTRFHLINNATGQELATHEMTAEPCK
jgi:hypothetical protein